MKTRQLTMTCFVAFFAGSYSHAQAPVSYIGLENGMAYWMVGSSRAYSQSARKLAVSGNGADEKSIGFTHSGYTASEPDGKVAVLTTLVELQPFESAGGSPLIGVSFPPLYTLDVNLASDLKEQERLRKELGFPKVIPAGSPYQLQIRWANVPGRTIYGWLTETNGLRLIATALITASASTRVATKLNEGHFLKWWNDRFGVSEKSGAFIGNATALVYDAIQSEVVSVISEPFDVSGALSTEVVVPIGRCIDVGLTSVQGTSKISRDAIRQCLEQSATKKVIELRLNWNDALRLGRELNDDNVIDSSQMKKGLKALLLDGS